MDGTTRVTSRAERTEPALTKMIQQHLRHDAARGVAGAEKQHIERVARLHARHPIPASLQIDDNPTPGAAVPGSWRFSDASVAAATAATPTATHTRLLSIFALANI